MAIITDAKGNSLVEFTMMEEEELVQVSLDAPLTHALIVVTYENKYLFMFNKWRRGWELPGGVIESGESARECVIRELAEETNQCAGRIIFKGLMKFELQADFHGPKRVEYGALFAGQLDRLEEFAANEEAERILLWDGYSDIGEVQEIDRKLMEFV